MPWFRCDGCGDERQSDPLGHSDWGGTIRIDGPMCDNPDCLNCGEVQMVCIGDDDLYEPI